MTKEDLLNEPGVQGLALLGRNAIDRITKLESVVMQSLEALQAARDSMLDRGVPTGPEHPHRLALTQVDAAISKAQAATAIANQIANQPETSGSPKPLTEEQVCKIFDSDCSSFGDGVLGFVRSIESAHGIRG
jgi:hypothetical protein